MAEAYIVDAIRTAGGRRNGLARSGGTLHRAVAAPPVPVLEGAVHG